MQSQSGRRIRRKSAVELIRTLQDIAELEALVTCISATISRKERMDSRGAP